MQKNKLIIEKILAKSGHTIKTLGEILDIDSQELLQQETVYSHNKLTELLRFLDDYDLHQHLLD